MTQCLFTFCYSPVIKASVKNTDVVFEDAPEILNEITQEPFRNDSHVAEGPVITARVYYVKVKKVFKVCILLLSIKDGLQWELYENFCWILIYIIL